VNSVYDFIVFLTLCFRPARRALTPSPPPPIDRGYGSGDRDSYRFDRYVFTTFFCCVCCSEWIWCVEMKTGGLGGGDHKWGYFSVRAYLPTNTCFAICHLTKCVVSECSWRQLLNVDNIEHLTLLNPFSVNHELSHPTQMHRTAWSPS